MPEERDEAKHAEEMGLSTSGDTSRLNAMLEETRHVIQQRVMEVETTVVEHGRRLALVEVNQTSFERALERLTDIMSVQATKSTLNEAAIVAIRERTDILAEHMEKATDRLAGTQVDDGKRISDLTSRVDRQDTKWTALQAVVLAILGVLVTITLQHLSTLIH